MIEKINRIKTEPQAKWSDKIGVLKHSFASKVKNSTGWRIKVTDVADHIKKSGFFPEYFNAKTKNSQQTSIFTGDTVVETASSSVTEAIALTSTTALDTLFTAATGSLEEGKRAPIKRRKDQTLGTDETTKKARINQDPIVAPNLLCTKKVVVSEPKAFNTDIWRPEDDAELRAKAEVIETTVERSGWSLPVGNLRTIFVRKFKKRGILLKRSDVSERMKELGLFPEFFRNKNENGKNTYFTEEESVRLLNLYKEVKATRVKGEKIWDVIKAHFSEKNLSSESFRAHYNYLMHVKPKVANDASKVIKTKNHSVTNEAIKRMGPSPVGHNSNLSEASSSPVEELKIPISAVKNTTPLLLLSSEQIMFIENMRTACHEMNIQTWGRFAWKNERWRDEDIWRIYELHKLFKDSPNLQREIRQRHSSRVDDGLDTLIHIMNQYV